MTRGLEILDVVLVPVGVLMLLAYQAQLAYRIRYHPSTTVLGINHINRRTWVRTMMQDGLKNGILSVQTLRNEIMASVLLATAAITLCAIIAALISTVSSDSFEVTSLLLGDKRKGTTSIKFLCVLICFLVAFMCNIQSVRYYCHVSFLISIPLGPNAPGLELQYVNDAMSMGAHFWSIGLRAFYFSFPMFLWLFGPIPMFLCSLILTILLHFLDTTNLDFKANLGNLQGPRDNDLLPMNNSN